MVNLVETNSNGSLLNTAFSLIAGTVPVSSQGTNPTYHASYQTYSNGLTLIGGGFTYDNNGYLNGGTIYSIDISYTVKAVGTEEEVYTNLLLPVSQAISLVGATGGATPVILAGNDMITANSSQIYGYGGNDTITLTGAGTFFSALPATTTAIDGGAGANTVIFPNALRSGATLIGGGGNESVSQSGIVANMLAIDKLQFIDGSTYEDNATAGAQASLIFEGVTGRLPDSINTGGYGQLAERTDTPTAARAILATTEGQADTASLSNADFVARLYQNMLHRAPDTLGAAGWQADLDSGQLDRGTVAAAFASGIEAQSANYATFASGSVFAANPNAVDVLRAYEVVLNRLPEASALSGNTVALNSGYETIELLYARLQNSAEFQVDTLTNQTNPYGITAGSSYAAIRGVALSDQVTSLITPLVTSNGVAVHS